MLRICAFSALSQLKLHIKIRLLFTYLIAFTMFAIASPVGADNSQGLVIQKDYDGPYEMNEVGGADVAPVLEVDGSPISPIADDTTDAVISLPGSIQTWTLLKEYTGWKDINRFGFYSDLGVGSVQSLIFSGGRNEGYSVNTSLSPGTNVGVWLLNDTNDDSVFNGSDSYLFSERALTAGSGANEHQWFMIYDVSSYKGTGATYNFIAPTEDFVTTGDFDYLIYIDDDHTSSNFDHNDMILGIVEGQPTDTCGNIIPGVPPNYFMVDSTYFAGVPSIPLPPPDSGGVYVYFDDANECWTIASHIYSKGNSLEQFHGSIIVQMDTPPESGVNVIIDNFELWHDTTANRCLFQNDRWGWSLWDADLNLYEIWWDVTTKEWKNGAGDANDFLKIKLFGCAIDFNVWSSGHGGPFSEAEIYLGAAMTRLGDVPGYTDYGGFDVIDQYQLAVGSDPTSDPNTSIFSPHCDTGASYNALGLITPTDSYVCDGIYGTNFSGAFVYQADGIQFSTICPSEPCGDNSAPVCNLPPDNTYLVCGDSTFSFSISASDIDENLLGCEMISGSGTFDGSNWSFTTSGPGIYSASFECIDVCGATCGGTVSITVNYNSPPIVNCPGDQTMFVCDLSPITISGFACADIDGNLTSCSVDNGSLVGSDVTFTPVVGANVINLTATDACGLTATCQTTITVSMNTAPTVACPGDQNMFVCDLSPITISGFACADSDGNLTACSVDNGTMAGSDVTFTPVVGANVINLTATDACGLTATCQTIVTVSMNSAPTVTCPGDQNMFVCDLSPITISGFTCADADANLTDCSVDNGSLVGSDVTFMPVVGANVINLTATDACGLTATCQTIVTITANSPPEIACPNTQTKTFLCEPEEICFGSGFTATDVDNNIISETISWGVLANSAVCFTPDTAGLYTFIYTVTDDCGASAVCTTMHFVHYQNSPPVCDIPQDETFFVCGDTTFSFPVSATDEDGNLVGCNLTSGAGSYDGANWTFTTTGPGIYTATFECSDDCGATCGGTVNITVGYNSAPTVTCASDLTLFVCDLSDITVSGFACDDVDGNLVDCSVDNGTMVGGDVTFTPVVGANVITLTATDACGEVASCQTTITVVMNSDPICDLPPDSTYFACVGTPFSFPISATDPDGNLIGCTQTSGDGSFDGTNWTFLAVPTWDGPSTFTGTFECIDDCGATCGGTVTIIVNYNEAPTVVCPGDETRFVCDLSPITLSGFICDDVDGNLTDCSVDNGSLIEGDVTFTPVAGINTITLTATDACGLTASCQTTITVTLNSPPVATCPGTQTIDLECEPSSPVQIGIGGFSYSDVNENVEAVSVNFGTYNEGLGDVTFTADTLGVYTIIFTVTDSCGATDQCQTLVNIVASNTPPRVACPGEVTLTVCDLSQICINGFGCIDDDDNLSDCQVDNGVLIGSEVCFTPVEGVNTIKLTATDDCGDTASCQAIVTVILNSPPVAECPTYVLREMGTLGEICIPGFSCSDPEGGLISCEISGVPGAVLAGGEVCFTPTAYGVYTLTLTATDGCNTVTCETTVDIVQVFDCPIVKIEKTHNTPQGQFETVSIFLENGTKQMGGFDFLIAYDASALTLVEAVPGQLLLDCEWEYFTYRFDAHGNCGDACPSGLLRIIALAETNNGPWHPSCYGPPDASGQYLLAEMVFYVSNDRTLNGMYVPIKFFWGDCGDNSIASVPGDTLYLDNAIYDFEGNLLWDEEDDDQFPEDVRPPFVGAVDFCMLGDKVFPVRCGEFWHGGIDIVHRDSIDAAGDINMNGVANEVADAVMMTNYFISGLSAFGNHVEGSIAASDVNNDGTVLSVADLVYLVRIIIGDALPYSKPSTSGMVTLNPEQTSGVLEIGYDSPSNNGAILLVLNYQGEVGEPILGDMANGMDIISDADGSTLRILIYNIASNSISSGSGQLVSIPIDGSIKLVEAETADYYGYEMETTIKSIPGMFVLEQNYPNPFNPSTSIRMTLSESAHWNVAIFNVAGQMVREYQGYSEAGSVEITWDGVDNSGQLVASGIYLYKATANQMTSTRKMVLMK